MVEKLVRKRRPLRSRSFSRFLTEVSTTSDGFVPIEEIDFEDVKLAQIESLSGVRYRLLELGVCPADSCRGVQWAIKLYISEKASTGVVTRDLIAFLKRCGACEDRIAIALDYLVETSYFISSKNRWFALNSLLIGFTSAGKPFYKGEGFAPSWIETDGMSRPRYFGSGGLKAQARKRGFVV